MKFAKLLHNPEAGEGELTKKELVSLIQSAGFGCSYSSTKEKGWEKLDAKDNDFIILAGGDGTVRKVAAAILGRTLLDRKLPIGILPMGTANNIARTLKLWSLPPEKIIATWKEEYIKKFDVGKIYGMGKSNFFLESIGFGLFPKLIEKMEKAGKNSMDSREKSLQAALEVTRELIMKAEAKYCRLSSRGVEHQGNFLMVEIMNTTSIGPTLNLAPLADPGDGFFDVVVVEDSQREKLIQYVTAKLTGREVTPFFTHFRSRKIQVFWDGNKAHIDDQFIEVERGKVIEVELLDSRLEFFTGEFLKGTA